MADPFHLNADYMKGVMYVGRRQFLGGDDDDNGGLKPPTEFMTKKQARVTLKVLRDNATNTVDFNHILHIKKSASSSMGEEEGGETKHHHKNVTEKANKRPTKAKRQPMIVIEEFSSTRPEDWTEESQAGVNTWVNHNTGEVSGICPWKAYGPDADENRPSEDEEVTGTGSIVYDGKEFDDFLSQLDDMVLKESKTTKDKP